ncbi:hypothetical protein GCM10010420_36700 [Streptomyces glaucosporus]|uniref:Uncharacterized protein n=1 Tax=Streptomyces glaucosporus TaxID=284044 RepID=A0ABP5VKB5_9ACTN
MAVKKIWTIDHACGHRVDRDLSNRPADRRAGYARWLAERDCTSCWRASHTKDAEAKAAWVEAKRAEELAEAEAWSAQYRMPPLEGTDRLIPWGIRCRHRLMTAAYTVLVVEGEVGEAEWERIEDAARTITRAGWWVDQRDADPEDLPELLEAATETDRPTENPYV